MALPARPHQRTKTYIELPDIVFGDDPDHREIVDTRSPLAATGRDDLSPWDDTAREVLRVVMVHVAFENRTLMIEALRRQCEALDWHDLPFRPLSPSSPAPSLPPPPAPPTSPVTR